MSYTSHRIAQMQGRAPATHAPAVPAQPVAQPAAAPSMSGLTNEALVRYRNMQPGAGFHGNMGQPSGGIAPGVSSGFIGNEQQGANPNLGSTIALDGPPMIPPPMIGNEQQQYLGQNGGARVNQAYLAGLDTPPTQSPFAKPMKDPMGGAVSGKPQQIRPGAGRFAETGRDELLGRYGGILSGGQP